jgi:DNA-binding beta-propeller fold protein YncE
MYNELFATIPNNKYYVAEKNLPTSAVVLKEEDTVYTSVLRPKTYTVKVEGAADQVLYAFDAYTITLPGTGVAGLKYK